MGAATIAGVRTFGRVRGDRAALLLSFASLLLVACAAAAPSAAGGPIRPGTASAPRDVNVILRDYVILPDPLRLVRGEVVRLNVINGGLVPHELVIGSPEVQAAWASAEAARTPDVITATPPPVSLPPGLGGLRVYLRSGESTSVLYEVPADGELQVACQIPGHVEHGMVGHIEFASPAP